LLSKLNSRRIHVSATIALILLNLFMGLVNFRPIKAEGSNNTLPIVAVHVSEYTRSHWFYTSWTYFQIYELLEEALRSDGTPFVEVNDSQVESGYLLTGSGLPKYPIFISLGAECISSVEAQRIRDYVQAGGFAYVGSSSWTRNQDGTPYVITPPSETVNVVADSEWDLASGPGADPRYVANKTLDGDPNTQWFTDNNVYDTNGLPVNGPINITYTFETVHEINKTTLIQTSWTGLEYKTKDYDVWVSPDGTSWNKVAQNTLPNASSAAQDTTFAPVNAKKVRITITSVWEPQVSHAAGLTEFKAFTTTGESLPAGPSAEYKFWLSDEMGLKCLPTNYDSARPELGGQGWWDSWSNVGISGRGVLVETTVDHPLVSCIPKGRRLLWILASTYNQCPRDSNTHFAWATMSTGATVLATFEWTGAVGATSDGYRDIPLIAYKNYGSGYFIYHSELAPLAGWGGFGVDTFTYSFFKTAIEWAFQANSVPLVRLAPWEYPMKAAFIMRLDCDGGIAPIMDYVAIDEARNVHGEFYVVTNDAASSVPDPAGLLTEAESHGAIIGSHSSYHTGPDSENYANAVNNINTSLNQLEAWLGHRPDVWVSPMYQAVAEQSLQAINACGLVSAGEQGVGPFPHFALSMETQGLHYGFLELPLLEYFSDRTQDYQPILECIIPFYSGCIDPNGTMANAIDLAYNLEGLINIYDHFRGDLEMRAFYIEYSQSKPDVWFTNSQDIYGWWLRRSQISIAPTYEHGFTNKIDVAVSGHADSGPFALNIKIPWQYQTMQVKVNGVIVSDYEITAEGLKVSCSSPSQVEILLDTPTLTMSPTGKTCREYNESFMIAITVSNEYDITDFEFEIHYNTTLLDYAGMAWSTWGSGTVNVDEVNGNITGVTSGTAVNGVQTLVAIQFNAAFHHVWKYESRVPGWRNDQNGLIYFQWANLSYAGSPDKAYLRGGGQNKINVGPDVVYTFAPIRGDVNNDGKVDIWDLRTVAALFKQSNTVYDLNGDGVIDILDVVAVSANYGYIKP
jgi:hypothetical protein